MKPVAAGLEVISGCFGLLGLLAFGLAHLVRSLFRKHTSDDDRLIRLIQDFISGYDQGWDSVQRIHHLLMTRFAGDYAYADVTTAAGSFSPGADNTRTLSEAFSRFLKQRYKIDMEVPFEIEEVWPPPPHGLGM